jgi:hypothetical protein
MGVSTVSLSIYLSVCLSVCPSVRPSVCLSIAVQPMRTLAALYTVGRTAWTGDQSVARPLPAHRTTQTRNKRTETSMPRVGLEPTIPVFKRANTVHALDRAATVIGISELYMKLF